MIVRELIEQLEGEDPNATVVATHDGDVPDLPQVVWLTILVEVEN